MRETDLQGADLRGANLSRADLSKANLKHAYLNGANLDGANLREAKLMRANLSGASLSEANLKGANLYEANLTGANLSEANLEGAVLSETNLYRTNFNKVDLVGINFAGARLFRADLSGKDLSDADLSGADLIEANLRGTDLSGVNLKGAELFEANLKGANLEYSILIETDFRCATLTNCRIYGISAWDLKLKGAIQSNLVITPEDEPAIQVNDLEVAQFIYLFLNNQKIRQIIDTVSSKVVLILGNFVPERKIILDDVAEALRNRDYVPVLFDFEGPKNRNLTETIVALAHLSRFVIADLTEPRCVPHELKAIIDHVKSVPVQPLLLSSHRKYAMFEEFESCPWVLPPVIYKDRPSLLREFQKKVIDPAEAKAEKLTTRK